MLRTAGNPLAYRARAESELTGAKDLLFFRALDSEHGDELWVSDGTSDGTVLLVDLVPGTGGSAPSEFTLVGDNLFFTAQTNEHGRQLWVLPIIPVPTARFSMTPDWCQSGRVVQLDAGMSTTPEGTAITRYAWDLGDGTTLEGERVEHEYLPGAAGTYRICLTLTNDEGHSDTICQRFCIGEAFVRGDTNADATLDLSDAIYVLQFLFASGAEPPCMDGADANDDGAIDLADGIYILQSLFASGPEIPPPYEECGVDPTVDALGCLEYAPCEQQR